MHICLRPEPDKPCSQATRCMHCTHRLFHLAGTGCHKTCTCRKLITHRLLSDAITFIHENFSNKHAVCGLVLVALFECNGHVLTQNSLTRSLNQSFECSVDRTRIFNCFFPIFVHSFSLPPPTKIC